MSKSMYTFIHVTEADECSASTFAHQILIGVTLPGQENCAWLGAEAHGFIPSMTV